MWRDLPPLAALRAFAAWYETGSMTAAGAALNVTHAAISQQIRALERHLGLPLVDRSGTQPVATEAGARLAAATGAGLAGIARVVAELTGAERDRPLVVTTSPAFASAWLLPRLAEFRMRHPEIDLMLDPSPALRSLGQGGADLALRYGDGVWPGLEVELLIRTPLALVAAPALVAAVPAGDLSALAGLPWLQELGTEEAAETLARLGLGREPGHGLTSLPGGMMLDAARSGQGLAMSARLFVEPDLAAGRLVLLGEFDPEKGYWLCLPPGPLRPAARAFRAWVRGQRPAATPAGD